jgi:hypothetical protein
MDEGEVLEFISGCQNKGEYGLISKKESGEILLYAIAFNSGFLFKKGNN